MLFLIALEFALRLILATVTLFVRWRNTLIRPVGEYAGSNDVTQPSVEWPDWEEDVGNSHSPTDTELRGETPPAGEDKQEQQSDEKTNVPAVP